jgi:hypothetical protein
LGQFKQVPQKIGHFEEVPQKIATFWGTLKMCPQ